MRSASRTFLRVSRVLASVAIVMMLGAQTNALAADSRARVTSPRDGQQFAPGDTVSVSVAIAPGFVAGYLVVNASDGIIQPSSYNASSYQAQYKIPEYFEGPLHITPFIVDSNNNPIAGVGVTVIVRSKAIPLSLRLPQSEFTINPAPRGLKPTNIYVMGVYANHVERDLTASASGTTYRSSDAHVLQVDANGHSRATGYGTAVVTIKNSGRKAFAVFWVDDPRNPNPPVDVTNRVSIARLPPQVKPFDPYTDSYAQTLRITNSMPIPLPGRLYVVVSDLPAKAVITNAGRTKLVEPTGSPYFWGRLPDGLTLQPGQRFTVTLKMWLLTNTPADYTVRVFQSLSEP